MVGFSLGQASGEHLRIDVLRRTHPDATNYWDGNWVTASIAISAGPWRGEYQASLRTEDFLGFRDQLRALYEDPDIKLAQLSSMEPWLELAVERSDALGHVTVAGAARREPFFEGHNVLQFTLEIDQSYLPDALAGLDAVVAQFPVIGSRYDVRGAASKP